MDDLEVEERRIRSVSLDRVLLLHDGPPVVFTDPAARSNACGGLGDDGRVEGHSGLQEEARAAVWSREVGDGFL